MDVTNACACSTNGVQIMSTGIHNNKNIICIEEA